MEKFSHKKTGLTHNQSHFTFRQFFPFNREITPPPSTHETDALIYCYYGGMPSRNTVKLEFRT